MIETIEYRPIGVVHSPFKTPEGAPIQPPGGEDAEATVEIYPDYAEGLTDLDGFSHIILLYHCHRAGTPSLMATPFLDNAPHGLFATRAPARPNPIGLSIVRLTSAADGILYIKEVDILDGAPVLDIKPYVPAFDLRESVRIGWMERRTGKMAAARDDGRFAAD